MKNIIIFLILLLALASIGAAMFRKEIPYDIDVAAGNDRIAVVNHTLWMNKDLKISYKNNLGDKGYAILSGAERETVIGGLVQDTEYTIRIGRNDIKGIRYKPKTVKVVTKERPYIVLIGASVGYTWDLPGLPSRMNDDRFIFGYRRGMHGFDKSMAIDELLKSDMKPDAIIIKECAAYFPRNTEESMQLITSWSQIIKEHNIVPILATVAPVTQHCADNRDPNMIQSINKFNEAIREYSVINGISILDLNKALEDGSTLHNLRDEYAQPDGLHINASAYRTALDPIIISLLNHLF